MDFQVSQKETRLQPEGAVDFYVPDVFDLFLVEEGNVIKNVLIVEDSLEIRQRALFASIRQKGSDPINPELGVRWAECLLGEVPPEVILVDIKNAVRATSTSATVQFNTTYDLKGNTVLSYDIKVV